MKFLDLHARLRWEVMRRIQHGALSSSLLARQTGLAQAHLSNFLHGRRNLSLQALDRVLSALALAVEDLSADDLSHSPPPEGKERDSMFIVPIVSQFTAMNTPVIPPRSILDTLQLPASWLFRLPSRRAVPRRLWDRFVAVRLTAPQAIPMQPVISPGGIAIIDRHYSSLVPFRPSPPNVYAVRSGSQLLFRHVAFESSRLILRPRNPEIPVDLIELASEELPSDFLVGRVCHGIGEL